MDETWESCTQTASPVQLPSFCLCSSEPVSELNSNTCSFCTRATRGDEEQASTLMLMEGSRTMDQEGARLTRSQAVNRLLEAEKN